MLILFLKHRSFICKPWCGQCFFRRMTIFDPFSTHQDTRIPRSIDVVWIQGARENGTARKRRWRREAWDESPENGLPSPHFSMPSPPPSAFLTHPLPLSPCAPFLSVSYTSSSLPVVLALASFLPPTSVHLFPSPLPPPPSCWHPCEPSELSEPLWISPYATYWAQDVLRTYVSGICERTEWTRLSDVAFINIAASSFRASTYQFAIPHFTSILKMTYT